MGICSWHGHFEPLRVNHSARLGGNWRLLRDVFFDLPYNNGILSVLIRVSPRVSWINENISLKYLNICFLSYRKNFLGTQNASLNQPQKTSHQCSSHWSLSVFIFTALQAPNNGVDGYTLALADCTCTFDTSRSNCACCQNNGCQCDESHQNQCVQCGHMDQCGNKPWIYGPAFPTTNWCFVKIFTLLPATCNLSWHASHHGHIYVVCKDMISLSIHAVWSRPSLCI